MARVRWVVFLIVAVLALSAKAETSLAVDRSGWRVAEASPGGPQFAAPLRERMQHRLTTMPAEYVPRTEHLDDDGGPEYTNRLVLETSPYLLQHAHNPVNWYPWGDEAFADAERLGRPVFLSIGYSTCHWCHVMERESFENVEIARYMNANFIAIKVDREERPDVDSVYMTAIQLLGQSGGWPMTVVLTPDRRPFFGGTYFPPTSLVRMLHGIADAYAADHDRIGSIAGQVTARLQAAASPDEGGPVADANVIHKAADALIESFDSTYGGFGGAPKFPPSARLELLLRYHRRTGNKEALDAVVLTLQRMASGGIYDQVGGGFHRYSTDARWLVPHFEKMLYDNAQLAVVYLEAFQVTAEPEFAGIARETLDYVAKEMTSVDGGFFSATDADSARSDGQFHEGWFFTWDAAEIDALLTEPEKQLVVRHYGVSKDGNFDGRSILSIVEPLAEVARRSGMSLGEARKVLNVARGKLYDARAKRAWPGKDTKILASWNGLMISAFARGALVLGDVRYREIAVRAATFVTTRMRRQDGSLRRSWKDGTAAQDGVLDDYAFMVSGLLDLFEACGDVHWLEQALALHATMVDRFADDERGGFYLTARDGESLLIREKPKYDGAEPSGNSVALLNALRLYEFTGSAAYKATAEGILRSASESLIGFAAATFATKLLVGLDYYLDTPKEIAIVGVSDEAGLASFRTVLARSFVPNRVLVVSPAAEGLVGLAKYAEWVEGKTPRGGKTTAYVCENRVCDLPTTDAEKFSEQIGRARPYAETNPPAK